MQAETQVAVDSNDEKLAKVICPSFLSVRHTLIGGDDLRYICTVES